MTEQELKAKIAENYRMTFAFLCSLQGWKTTDMIPEGIMKEAEECESVFVDSVLALIKEAGYVQLDPDQNLPLYRTGHYIESAAGRTFIHDGGYGLDSDDVLKAGFRKVKDGS